MIKGGIDVSRESDKVSYKRPGPRLSACQWCGKVTCNHCRCTGQNNCHHAPGEMCKNQRYKRRLVCNPCEKNKLKNRQLYQQRMEKKGMATNPTQGVYPDSMMAGLDPSRMKSAQGYSTSLKLQCPNVAVLFYKTQQVLTMIPITAFQNTLSQIRKLISSMKLFIDDTKFIFIHENVIINFEDESKIAAMSVLREYAFPYPINCNRCIIIHIRPPVSSQPTSHPPMVPMNVIPQQMAPVWSQSYPQPSLYAPSNSSQQPLPSKPLSVNPPEEPIPDGAQIDPSSGALLPANIPNLVENPDLPKSGLFPHLSRDSAQWFLPPSEIMVNQGGSFGMDMRASFSQGYLPAEGHPLGYREEGLSSEFIPGLSPAPRNTSYSDMSFLLPFHGGAVARRASESEFNWPVFAKRPEMAGDQDEAPLYATELGHPLEPEARGSTLSAEDMQLSSVLSGLKRDRAISERRDGNAKGNGDGGSGSGKDGQAPESAASAPGGGAQANSEVV